MGIVTGGWYAASLQPFFDVFGDQLIVLLHDDVKSDPRAVFDRAVHHVGAAPGFVPTSLERVVFSNQPGGDKAGLSESERRGLFEYFRDEIDRLESMLQRELGAWRPTNTQ